MEKIGPTFYSELVAEFGTPQINGVAWTPSTGEITFTEVSDEDQARVKKVLEAHDPTRQLQRPPGTP